MLELKKHSIALRGDSCYRNTLVRLAQGDGRDRWCTYRAFSTCVMLRNRDQAKYIKFSTKASGISHLDSPVILLTQGKREQLQQLEKTMFIMVIMELTNAPALRCILVYDCKLKDPITFSTAPEFFSVLGVDPTSNLRRFKVAVTTYKHHKFFRQESR